MNYDKVRVIQEIDKVKEMITRNEYVVASDKLLELQHYFPDLDKISEMIAISDILCYSEFDFLSGGTDWYWILQVAPSSSEFDIERKYLKLVACLEHIKDDFPGTASAMKILQDAFSVLSHFEKRLTFDSKRTASLRADESTDIQEITNVLGACCLTINTNAQKEDISLCSTSSKRAADQTLDGLISFNRAPHEKLDGSTSSKRDSHVTPYSCTGSKRAIPEAPEVSTSSRSTLAIRGVVSERDSHVTPYGSTGSKRATPGAPDSSSGSKRDNHVTSYGFTGSKRVTPEALDGSTDSKRDSHVTPYGFTSSKRATLEALDGYTSSKRDSHVTLYDSTSSKRATPEPPDRSTSSQRDSHVTLYGSASSKRATPEAPDKSTSSKRDSHVTPYVSADSKIAIHETPDGSNNPRRDTQETSDGSSNPKKATHETPDGSTSSKRFTPDTLDDSVSSKRAAHETQDGKDDEDGDLQHPLMGGDAREDDLLKEMEVHSVGISTQTDVTNGINIDELVKKLCSGGNFIYDSKVLVTPQDKVVVPADSDCSSQKPVVAKLLDREFNNLENMRGVDSFAVGQIWAAYDEEKMPRRYARINSINRFPFSLDISWLRPSPLGADERRWLKVGLPVACGNFELERVETMTTEVKMFSHMVSCLASPPADAIVILPKEHEIWAIYKDWTPRKWCSDPEERKGCTLQMVEIITSYSGLEDVMVVGLEKVKGFTNIFRRHKNSGCEHHFTISSRNLFRFSHKVAARRFLSEEMGEIPETMFELDPLAIPDIVDCHMEESSAGCPRKSATSTDCLQAPPLPLLHLDTQLLDIKWSAENFHPEQIWAVYDGPDSMPWSYVIVNNVVSADEVCVSCLEPHPMNDDEIYWVEENLPFVCGLFKASKSTHNLQMSMFAHAVECLEQSVKKSFYKIYPRKGEIWAVYRNWNSRWKQTNLCHYSCQIVEVISDFNEKTEIRTASLVEVPGCMTFFQRQFCNGFELIRTVSRTEMLSFSHRVVAFNVSGSGRYGIPEGSWHLEPDALPFNCSKQF